VSRIDDSFDSSFVSFLSSPRADRWTRPIGRSRNRRTIVIKKMKKPKMNKNKTKESVSLCVDWCKGLGRLCSIPLPLCGRYFDLFSSTYLISFAPSCPLLCHNTFRYFLAAKMDTCATEQPAEQLEQGSQREKQPKHFCTAIC
jgi:hypothetical protein